MLEAQKNILCEIKVILLATDADGCHNDGQS